MGGFHLGNVVSFLATPIIMSHIGLAGTFAFFASLGYVWLSVWLLNVESDPIDSRTISKSELQLILAGRSKSKAKGDKFPSLREVFSKMGMWAIIVANVINNWVRKTDHQFKIWLYCCPDINIYKFKISCRAILSYYRGCRCTSKRYVYHLSFQIILLSQIDVVSDYYPNRYMMSI
jgi:hypothetical protein